MGSAPRFVSKGFYEPSGPVFIGVRVKTKRNGCFCWCHWETLAPRPPVYGHEQEGPVQFQWVTCLTKSTIDSFFGQTVTSYTPTNPFKPTRLSQPHDGHLICFIASRSTSVLLSGVSPKSVSLAREGLTGRPQRDRPKGHTVCPITYSIDRLRGTVLPFSFQTITASPYS